MYRPISLSQHSIRGNYLTDDELVRQVDDYQYQIRVLTIENKVIENALNRLDPNLLVGIQQTVDYAVKLHFSNVSSVSVSFGKSSTKLFDAISSLASPSRVFGSPSKLSTKRVESSGRLTSNLLIPSGPRVNILERSEILSNEMELINKKLLKAWKQAEKKKAVLNAKLEEIALKEADIEKAVATFNKVVKEDGFDPIAQRIPAEVWVRFMTEWLRESDCVLSKLRLRTHTLNSLHGRLKSQIKEISELSEHLRPVDFEKIKIENDVKKKIIDNKFHQVIELKRMSGEANFNLSKHKSAMIVQNNYLKEVKQQIKIRENQTNRIKKETDSIQEQSEKIATALEEVKTIRSTYQVQDMTADYINVKAEMTELKHAIKVLENRLHIVQVDLRSLNKKLNSFGDGSGMM